jgi:hypothetical protein
MAESDQSGSEAALRYTMSLVGQQEKQHEFWQPMSLRAMPLASFDGPMVVDASDPDTALSYTLGLRSSLREGPPLVLAEDPLTCMAYTAQLVLEGELATRQASDRERTATLRPNPGRVPASHVRLGSISLRTQARDIAELKATIAELRKRADQLSAKWRAEESAYSGSASARVHAVTGRAAHALHSPARIAAELLADHQRGTVSTPFSVRRQLHLA